MSEVEKEQPEVLDRERAARIAAEMKAEASRPVRRDVEEGRREMVEGWVAEVMARQLVQNPVLGFWGAAPATCGGPVPARKIPPMHAESAEELAERFALTLDTMPLEWRHAFLEALVGKLVARQLVPHLLHTVAEWLPPHVQISISMAEDGRAAHAEQVVELDCPVCDLLASFVDQVRAWRAVGILTEILQAPECGSDNTWRAEVRRYGTPIRLRWAPTIAQWRDEA